MGISLVGPRLSGKQKMKVVLRWRKQPQTSRYNSTARETPLLSAVLQRPRTQGVLHTEQSRACLVDSTAEAAKRPSRGWRRECQCSEASTPVNDEGVLSDGEALGQGKRIRRARPWASISPVPSLPVAGLDVQRKTGIGPRIKQVNEEARFDPHRVRVTRPFPSDVRIGDAVGDVTVSCSAVVPCWNIQASSRLQLPEVPYLPCPISLNNVVEPVESKILPFQRRRNHRSVWAFVAGGVNC